MRKFFDYWFKPIQIVEIPTHEEPPKPVDVKAELRKVQQWAKELHEGIDSMKIPEEEKTLAHRAVDIRVRKRLQELALGEGQ